MIYLNFLIFRKEQLAEKCISLIVGLLQLNPTNITLNKACLMAATLAKSHCFRYINVLEAVFFESLFIFENVIFCSKNI